MNRVAELPGPGSYLAFLLWALLMVAALPGPHLLPVTAAILLFAVMTGGRGLRIFARPRFWLFILFILALSPFLLGEPDLRWGMLGLSRDGLTAGCWMALRAMSMMLAFSAVLEALTVSQLINLFDQLGLRGLGFALGVALNLLLTLQDVVGAAYHTIWLRGGWRRPLRNGQLFLVTVIANALRYGDDIVRAATARGFDPAAKPKKQRPNRLLGRFDRVFLIGLVASAAGLLLPWWR